MDDEYKNTAVIVLPVLWPSNYPKPDKSDLHVTLTFLGDIDENELVKDDVIDAILQLDHNIYAIVDVVDFDLFGPDKDIPVLRVENEVINLIYRQLTEELAARNIPWSQNYEFTPHVTIDDTIALEGWPPVLWIKPVELWWKNEKVKFL